MLFISKGGNKKQNKKEQLPESPGSELEGRLADPDHPSGLLTGLPATWATRPGLPHPHPKAVRHLPGTRRVCALTWHQHYYGLRAN